MRFAFIKEEAKEAVFPVVFMCRVLEVTRSGYYAWLNRKESVRQRDDDFLKARIKAHHDASNGTYGSPKIQADLLEFDQRKVSRKRVQRLMVELGIAGVPKKKYIRTTDSNHSCHIAENILDRNFEADAPNKVWVTDITYISSWEGFSYHAAIIDLFNREVVGWANADNMRTGLVLSALEMAVKRRRPPKGLIHHSDRGSQYESKKYQKKLKEHAMICSMSRKGNCWDNAVAESFFGTLKQELIYRRPWPTRRRAERAIADYILTFYNCRRRHSKLDYMSPMDYEKKMLSQKRAA